MKINKVLSFCRVKSIPFKKHHSLSPVPIVIQCWGVGRSGESWSAKIQKIKIDNSRRLLTFRMWYMWMYIKYSFQWVLTCEWILSEEKYCHTYRACVIFSAIFLSSVNFCNGTTPQGLCVWRICAQTSTIWEVYIWRMHFFFAFVIEEFCDSLKIKGNNFDRVLREGCADRVEN